MPRIMWGIKKLRKGKWVMERKRERFWFGLTYDEDGSIPTTLQVCGVMEDQGIALGVATTAISHGEHLKFFEVILENVVGNQVWGGSMGGIGLYIGWILRLLCCCCCWGCGCEWTQALNFSVWGFGIGWNLFFYLCITLVWQFGFFFLPK